MSSSKETAYRALIHDARNSYESKNLSLYWHPDCEEINLWTYWQGRNCLDAKIMLVGQDWGAPTDDSAETTMKQIRLANQNLPYKYLEDNPSITDKRLTALFQEIGYDITTPQAELFFTNFILGYRYAGLSGGYKLEWAEHDKTFMKRLVNIIHPKVVLCLGRSTFEGVISGFDYKFTPKIGSYNSFIESTRNPVSILLEDGQTVHIFALAHCGAMGTLNRNKSKALPGKKATTNADLTNQIADWKKILSYL